MILVLDLGSSSTRATLYDEHGRAVPTASARVPVEFSAGADGRSEDDLEGAFARVVAVLDALHAIVVHRPSFVVHDLGISSYASSLVCLDESGAPLTPIYTYADTRCAEDARRLRRDHDEAETLQRTGCRIRANYLPAKIAWLKRTQPEVMGRVRWLASLSDAVGYRLFGRMRTGVSIASWSGLLNRRTADWDAQWLQALGVSGSCLPPIAGDGEVMEGLLPEWAARWPAFAHLRSHPPVGDGAVANVGSGCVDESRIAVTIGSTAAMRVVRTSTLHFRLPSALWAYRVDHAHELIGGATTEGGNVFAWARATLNLPGDDEALEAAVAAMPPDAHGLTVLPTFAGERSPGYAEDIRATLHGLSFDTTPVEIVRALMEGVAYRLAHICDALRESGAARRDAILIGSGGALQRSPTWRQIIADVTGVPLQLTTEPEATSRGVAVLALKGLPVGPVDPVDRVGRLADSSLSPTTPTGLHVHHPDPERHAIYRAAMARQEELYAQLVRSDE